MWSEETYNLEPMHVLDLVKILQNTNRILYRTTTQQKREYVHIHYNKLTTKIEYSY